MLGSLSYNNSKFNAKGKRKMIRKNILLVLVPVVVLVLAVPCFGGSIIYEYDDLYRLTKATYADGMVFEYTYDEAGNRLTKVIRAELVILHKDGAIWSSDAGWNLDTPPNYPGTAYAVDIEYRADGSYMILHKDGAV